MAGASVPAVVRGISFCISVVNVGGNYNEDKKADNG